MRIRILSIYFFFSVLALIPFERSTATDSIPEGYNLMWLYYQAGQGKPRESTFITDTETTCDIDVRVAVEHAVPGGYSIIRNIEWEVEASHGFTFTRNWSKNYMLVDSGRIYTVFTYSGSGIGNPHSGTARSTHCSNYGGTTNPPNGRQNKPIEITVTFKGTGYRDSPINISHRFIQDEIDQIRQEYVDLQGTQMKIKPDDPEMSIPSRTAFSDSNSYNSGHYGQMIDASSHVRGTPPCGDSAHAGYACQISSDHMTEISGWSGTFYECQPHTTFPCGHTDLNIDSAYHAYDTFPCGISTHVGHACTATAASDGLNHTLQASCSLTNANGDSCALTNFYACQPHTCVYSCGRSGCSQTVSSSTQHGATCASGHPYWTCKSSDVSLHRTRTCRKCSKSWERCSTVGGTPLCDDPWRRSRGLPCWKKE